MQKIIPFEKSNMLTKNQVPWLKRELLKYIKNKYLIIMLLPAILYYTIFHYTPVYGVQIAFKNYIFNKGIWGSPWNGFENFKYLFSIGSFWEVLSNTLIISVYKLVFGFPAPIIFAILLNEIRLIRFKKITQTISYLPHFISWVVLSGMFIQLLSPSIGPINGLLKIFGIESIYFVADPKWFRTILVVTSIWKEIGWGSIIYLAALAGVNPELFEAAIVDGAGRFKRIIHITLPSLSPVITIMLIFAIGGIINDDFDQIFNLYNVRVYRVADVLSTYTYRMGLVNMEYSFATAVGLFKNIIAFTLIIITNSITKKINEYGIW